MIDFLTMAYHVKKYIIMIDFLTMTFYVKK